jgi:hypothetical protein
VGECFLHRRDEFLLHDLLHARVNRQHDIEPAATPRPAREDEQLVLAVGALRFTQPRVRREVWSSNFFSMPFHAGR